MSMTLDERVEAIVTAMVLAGEAECRATKTELPEFALSTVSLAVRMTIAVSPDLEAAKSTMTFVLNDLFSQAERVGKALN
jgi:hypothetical protein